VSDPTSGDHPTHVGGARWCAEHKRFECTASKKGGRGDCHSIAIDGTSKCRMHAGVTLEVAKAQGQARITAFSALGGTPAVEPGRAVLASLHMAWLRVHLYARLLEEQVGDEADDPVGGYGESQRADDGYGVGVGRQSSPAGVAGLIGHTYAADKAAGIFASGEAVRALVQLEAQERDRCVRYAKTAHDMGIAEREVRLAEQQGQLLASVIRNVLGDLDLSEEQQERVPRVVQARLLEVTQLEATGGAA
jgi:hypothetical protein